MPPQQFLADRPGKITPKILSEQTRFSYDVFPVTVAMLVVGVSIMAYVIWQNVGGKQAGYWFQAIAAITLCRVVLYIFYKRYGQDGSPLFWRRAFLAGAYTSASMMSLAVLLFYNDFDANGKMVFMLLIIGIVSGALPVLATDLKAYAFYLVLCLMPLSFFNLATPSISVKLIGAVMIIFIGMLMLAAHLFNRALLDSLIYRYRSELLADRLQIANNRLSSANLELQQISTTDELTEVFNRRYFNQRYKEVWDDHVREGQSLAALMIDVDHFKAYNDQFGHLQGDHCLKRIADEITGVINRPRDFVSRFGGEEFIMLLPNTDIKGAQQIAARIHNHIERLAIPHRVENGPDRVTVSIGGAALKPNKETSSEFFLQQVDRALYKAKHNGRNTSIFV